MNESIFYFCFAVARQSVLLYNKYEMILNRWALHIRFCSLAAEIKERLGIVVRECPYKLKKEVPVYGYQY